MHLFFLFFFLFINSAELPDFESKEEGLVYSIAGGRLWRRLKDLESADLASDSSVQQNSDFVFEMVKGYVLETEAKFRFNKYFTPLVAYVYGNASHGRGYFNIYNTKDCKFLEEVEFYYLKPKIIEEFITIANESEIFKTDLRGHEIIGDLFLGYFLERDIIRAEWSNDASNSKLKWYGFRVGIKLNVGISERLKLAIFNFFRAGRLKSISSRDSLLGLAPGRQSINYYSDLVSLVADYEISDHCNLGLFLELDNAFQAGKTKIILDAKDRELLINPRIRKLREFIYSLSLGLGFSF